MNALVPIDSKDLHLVTGGGSSTKNLDALLGTLHSVTSSINSSIVAGVPPPARTLEA